MVVPVTFNGINYAIPEDEETGWESLTDFLVAVAQNAAVTTGTSFNSRTATTTPQTLQATDTILYMNVGSASVVNLPAGVAKQIYGVYDLSGAARTNNITVTPNGAELINGAATYVINANYAGIFFQFNGTSWEIISEYTYVFKSPRLIENNPINASYVENSITSNGANATAANLASSSASFTGSYNMLFAVAVGTSSLILSTNYTSNKITAISDMSNLLLLTDAGTGLYVSKSINSNVITFKNRMGTSQVIEIMALTNLFSSPTVWA